MKKVSLSGSLRENVGKKDAKEIRRQGLVPAVIYGGEKQIHFSIEAGALNKLIYTPDVYQVELDLNGEKYNTIVQEMQFHPVTDKAIHVDFLQLFDDKLVTVNLPVVTKGNALGVINGGRLAIGIRTLPVQGLPGQLPDAIEVDITALRIGFSIRVRDLNADGLTIVKSPSDVVVAVKATRVAQAGSDEEEAEGEAAAETPAEGAEA